MNAAFPNCRFCDGTGTCVDVRDKPIHCTACAARARHLAQEPVTEESEFPPERELLLHIRLGAATEGEFNLCRLTEGDGDGSTLWLSVELRESPFLQWGDGNPSVDGKRLVNFPLRFTIGGGYDKGFLVRTAIDPATGCFYLSLPTQERADRFIFWVGAPVASKSRRKARKVAL